MQLALPILKTLYDTTKSEQLKFQVEAATCIGSRQAYHQLQSPCGPIISLLTISVPEKSSVSTGRSLTFAYEIIVLDKPADAPSIVLENQETGRLHTVPSQIPFPDQYISNSQSVTLPPNLPHGRYRVYLQFTRDGEVVSRGHYAKAEL